MYVWYILILAFWTFMAGAIPANTTSPTENPPPRPTRWQRFRNWFLGLNQPGQNATAVPLNNQSAVVSSIAPFSSGSLSPSNDSVSSIPLSNMNTANGILTNGIVSPKISPPGNVTVSDSEGAKMANNSFSILESLTYSGPGALGGLIALSLMSFIGSVLVIIHGVFFQRKPKSELYPHSPGCVSSPSSVQTVSSVNSSKDQEGGCLSSMWRWRRTVGNRWWIYRSLNSVLLMYPLMITCLILTLLNQKDLKNMINDLELILNDVWGQVIVYLLLFTVSFQLLMENGLAWIIVAMVRHPWTGKLFNKNTFLFDGIVMVLFAISGVMVAGILGANLYSASSTYWVQCILAFFGISILSYISCFMAYFISICQIVLTKNRLQKIPQNPLVGRFGHQRSDSASSNSTITAFIPKLFNWERSHDGAATSNQSNGWKFQRSQQNPNPSPSVTRIITRWSMTVIVLYLQFILITVLIGIRIFNPTLIIPNWLILIAIAAVASGGWLHSVLYFVLVI